MDKCSSRNILLQWTEEEVTEPLYQRTKPVKKMTVGISGNLRGIVALALSDPLKTSDLKSLLPPSLKGLQVADLW